MKRGVRPAKWLWLVALSPTPLAAQAAPQPPDPDEIIVEGRRANERYRLPQDMRMALPEASSAPRAFDPRLACQNVGPYSCGTDLVPIVTVRSDGSTQIGTGPDER
ncbi:hypothetical protein H9L13_04440 [Sphingomonas lutea]|uniref:TonB-dependent receptor n=1 Tax=Sphingomonas lutea TaxID=1045317 RepID=A0A7G9SJW5_9SPHN|nr:hypothetical protein [Sphingomonas lutea]QNN68140.1 hypothetical protein H9L13_04440 [Sphingomonas lutea]